MPQKPIVPIIKLTAEQKKRLEVLDEDIKRIEIASESLKEIGFGVETVMEHVEWAKKVRKMLLERFS